MWHEKHLISTSYSLESYSLVKRFKRARLPETMVCRILMACRPLNMSGQHKGHGSYTRNLIGAIVKSLHGTLCPSLLFTTRVEKQIPSKGRRSKPWALVWAFNLEPLKTHYIPSQNEGSYFKRRPIGKKQLRPLVRRTSSMKKISWHVSHGQTSSYRAC